MNRMETNTHRQPRLVLPTDPITEVIIGSAMQVHNELGNGFLEKVYENALVLDLREAGQDVNQQVELDVIYHGQCVGVYVPDIVVVGQVIVEVKAVRALDDIHIAQCKNYLKTTGLSVCRLINFGQSSLAFKRIIQNPIR